MPGRKPPFRVLFSNDTIHIESCLSPYSQVRQFPPDPANPRRHLVSTAPFTAEMLEASVDETVGTGVDVHLLQPGVGWVPWWNSRVYPFAEHVRFMGERYGKKPSESGFAGYMAGGGDMVAVFVRRCRQKGLTPFVSLRLNDSHGHEFVDAPPAEIPPWAWHVLTPIHVQHPEWRIGPDLNDWDQRVLNWTIPQVRQLKLAFIAEICEQYDLDGFELDFMRHASFFPADAPSGQRRDTMTGFVSEVRAILDRTTGPGQHRWLCVRVPAHLGCHDRLGVHLPTWTAAGAEMVNLSYSYFTVQDGDLAAIRALAPEAALYAEMCHTIRVGPVPRGSTSYDSFTFRRTTPTQFRTTAHQAYARGLDSVSLFNFVYYREHGLGDRGPFAEPPFHVLERLGDRDWLASHPQHYFLTSIWHLEGLKPASLPRSLVAGGSAVFEMDLAPPAGGWQNPGILRIQADSDLGDSRWRATCNDAPLEETPDRLEPYANPYPPLLGTPEQHRAWVVLTDLLRDGVNSLTVMLEAGTDEARLVFVDMALP